MNIRKLTLGEQMQLAGGLTALVGAIGLTSKKHEARFTRVFIAGVVVGIAGSFIHLKEKK